VTTRPRGTRFTIAQTRANGPVVSALAFWERALGFAVFFFLAAMASS
jgi:hypothetical protein